MYMKTTKQLLCVGGLLLAGAVAQAQDPNLIDITTLEHLDAMRYDLDGNGEVSFTTASDATGTFGTTAEEETAFGEAAVYASVFTGGSYYEGSSTTAATGTISANTEYTYKIDASAAYTGYELMNNLDFAGTKWASGGSVSGGWKPIGDNRTAANDSRFTAIFDGNHNTISNLYINRAGADLVGLFGFAVSSSEIRNLGLIGGSVTGGGSGSPRATGGLVGVCTGAVSACYATGNVTSSSHVGGLVGQTDGGTITTCYATGNVISTGSSRYVGGLVGWNSRGPITYCYATGNATGTEDVGGLVGQNTGDVTACYATGDATATGSGVRAGGLIGKSGSATITACYATGNATATGSGSLAAGLVADDTGTITASYFDSDVSNRTDSDANSQTTLALQLPVEYTDIYIDWDGFQWSLCGDSEYPKLFADFDGDGRSSVGEFGDQGSCSSVARRVTDLETSNMALETNQAAQTTQITDLETSQDAQGTEIETLKSTVSVLETSQGTQTTQITALETSQGTQTTQITALETSQGTQTTQITALETSQGTQTTQITALETSQGTQDATTSALEATTSALETSQTTQDDEITVLKAKIKALEDALDAADIEVPDIELPTSGGDNTGALTIIYNVPSSSASARVYPNPAAHKLFFANLTPGRVYMYKMYTSSGILLRSGAVQSDEAIDISTLEAGQYLLVLQDDADREVLRSSLLIE